jgi:hypothetical protein
MADIEREKSMSKNIFLEGEDPNSRAYFGWQDGDLALFGLKEGYKNSADNLVDIALTEGLKGDIKTLDTYIFPIIFCYRHALEISLKHIFYRFYGKLPNGNHDLIVLFDSVKEQVINIFNTPNFIEEAKKYKNVFVKYSIDNIDFNDIRRLICELQGADNKADIWRYLMNKEGQLYFTDSKFVDYQNLKVAIGELYEVFDFIHFIISEYLSGDPI